MISFDVLIDKESTDFVHHFDAYLCNPDDMEKIQNVSNLSYECGPGGDDGSLNLLKDVCEARSMIFAWVILFYL